MTGSTLRRFLLCAAMFGPVAAVAEEPAESVPSASESDTPPPEPLGGAAAASGPTVSVEAELLRWDGAAFEAQGDVRVQRGDLLLRAPRAFYDVRRRFGRIDGGVTATDGHWVLHAGVVELASRQLRLLDASMGLVSGVDPDVIRRAGSASPPQDLDGLGRRTLQLRASRIEQQGNDTLLAQDLSLTPCECAPGETPFLRISASEAWVRAGYWARFTGAVVRVEEVPVLYMPYLIFPLSQRRSGLLWPRMQVGGPSRFGLEWPVFVTLGPSADVTVAPLGWVGPSDGDDPEHVGVRGLGVSSEWRWAPAEGSEGTLRSVWMYDASSGASGARGPRWMASLSHVQPLGPHLRGHVVAEVLGDSNLLSDTAIALDRAQVPFASGHVGVAGEAGPISWALTSTAIEALPAQRLALSDVPATASPVLAWSAGTHRMGRRWAVDARTSVTLDRTLWGEKRSDQADRWQTVLSLGQTWNVADGARGRLRMEARQHVSWTQLDRTDGAGSLAGRGLTGADGVRAGATLGSRLDTTLSRAWGRWTHRLEPSVETRGWVVAGSSYAPGLYLPSTPLPRSGADAALPPEAGLQLVSRLGSRLSADAAPWWNANLEHHQSLAGAGGQAGQMRFDLSTGMHPWSAEAAGGIALARGQWTLASTGVRREGQRRSFGLGLQYVNAAVDDQLGRPSDLLFAPIPPVHTPIQQRVVSGRVSGEVHPNDHWILRGGAVLSNRIDAATWVQQYDSTVVYSSGGCARLSLQARWIPGNSPVVNLGFEWGDVRRTVAAAVESALGGAPAGVQQVVQSARTW